MKFLLQTKGDAVGLDVDYAILKDLLVASHSEYEEAFLHDFMQEDRLLSPTALPPHWEHRIPLGSIDFVSSYLNIFHNIKKMNPIEVPVCLRTEEFLKREYSIVLGKDIAKTGQYFVKNAHTLKDFVYMGDMEEFHKHCYSGEYSINPDGLYQVSEIVNIQAEYRVYVISGKIYAIAYYLGNPCIFPDVALINKANLLYSLQRDYPSSYTMDVMVNERGTSIIEVHPLFSCGLYQTVLGTDFLYGYYESLQYLIHHNTPPVPCAPIFYARPYFRK